MRIEYENKFSDIFIFNATHQLLSIVVQGFFLLVTTGIVLIELNDSSDNLFQAIIIGLVYYIAMWSFQLIFNVIYLYSKKDKSILTKHIIEIQDEALYEETKYNKSFFYWNGIDRIVKRPGFVAVYVTKHMAHIIPSRAFNSDKVRTEFFNLINDKLKL